MVENSLARIGRNSIIAGIGMLLNGPLSYLISICLIRWLGVSDFGLYTLLFTIVSIVSVFGSLGMQVGVARYVAHYLGLNQADKAAMVFRVLSMISMVLSIILAIVLWGTSSWVARLLQKPDMLPLLKIVALSIPSLVLQDIWLYTLRGLQKIGHQITIEKLVTPVLMFTLTMTFYLLHFDLQRYLYGVVVVNYLIAGCLGWTTWHQLGKSKGIQLRKNEVGEWLLFSLPVLLERLILLFLAQAGWEVLLIAHYGIATDVGIYGLLYRIMPVMMFPAVAFSIAFGPTIPALYAQKKIDSLKHNFAVVNRWIATFTLPLFLLLVIWSKEILRLSGSKLETGQIALCILATGFLVDALVGEVRGIMLMTGKSGMFLLNSGGLMILNLVLNLYLVPKWGIIGAATAGAISRALFNLIGLAQVFIFIRIHPFNQDYFKPFAAALIASIACFITLLSIPGQGISETLLRSVIVIVIYIATIIVLGLSEEELAAMDFLRKFITNRGYSNVSQ